MLVPKSVESIEWFQDGRGNLSSLFETLTLGKFESRGSYHSPVVIQVKLTRWSREMNPISKLRGDRFYFLSINTPYDFLAVEE